MSTRVRRPVNAHKRAAAGKLARQLRLADHVVLWSRDGAYAVPLDHAEAGRLIARSGDRLTGVFLPTLSVLALAWRDR